MQRRTWVYAGLALIAPLAIWVQGSNWHGDTQLHTVIEVVATLLVFQVGIVAMVGFYAHRSSGALLLGTGFIGAGLLDGFHAIVTSEFFHQLMPSAPPSLIPWSWNASRTYLSVLMALSWWVGHRKKHLSEATVYAVVAGMTGATFVVFTLVPLPRAYYPELFFGRPEELVSAVFFAVALWGYLRQGDWRTAPLAHAIVCSLVVHVIAQAVVMSRSFGLFDAMFDLAHLLKVVGYAIVLAGMVRHMFLLFRKAESVSESQAKELQTRVELSVVQAAHAKLAAAQEGLVRSNRDLERFAYVASHDLQEPIRTMGSYADLLSKRYAEQLDEKAQRWLGFMTGAAGRMKDLLNDLLNFSRVESRAKAPTMVDVGALLQSIRESLDVRLGETGAALRVGTMPAVLADPAQLGQVFQNLIINALKFAEGVPEVRVDAVKAEGVWRFSVADNGIGIASKDHGPVFEAFRRLHAVQDYPGTGMGLAIVRRIVEHHGGTIWVESAVGEGATFYFTIPEAGDAR